MNPETVAKVFEYFTGISFDTMLKNVAKEYELSIMSEKKKRHLKRYLRLYNRRSPDGARIAKSEVSQKNPFFPSGV